MSANPTLLLARRSMRARIGRLIAIGAAIVLGVSFVVGSFVLADSMRAGFDTLFTNISQNVDLQVRTAQEFQSDQAQDSRDPVSADLLDVVAAVPGVANVDGDLQRTATLVDEDGKAITAGGAPTLGVSWDGEADDDGAGLQLRDGTAPTGPDQVAIDKITADKQGFSVGDSIDIVTDTGRHTFTISGLIGLGDTDGFAGATVAVFDPATAAVVFDAEGVLDAIEVQIDDGADEATVQAAIEQTVPANVEVITRQEVIDEDNSSVNTFIGPFSTGLLIFAFITAFVSAFLINNVFAITIGQRLRELALLRALGGGGRQVRRLIVSEALILSLIATVVGIAGGLGVAKAIIAIFNAAGAGFPDFPILLRPRSVLMGFLVGVGITMAAVIIPARRAAKIPPVAAMRPELGFDALGAKRLVAGVVTVVVGAALFLLGLFARPGGTVGLIALAGGGALLLFLGAASVSSTVARPVTSWIGWPIGRLYGATGQLARGNAGRAPKRTSATAAALMIGVALVSASAVFAASLRTSFTSAMDRGVRADYFLTADNFGLLPLELGDRLAELPELSAVANVGFAAIQVDGEQKAAGVLDPETTPELLDIGLEKGSWSLLAEGGVFVNQDPADDLDLDVGDSVDVTFSNGTERTLPVAGIFSDSTLTGANWLISFDTLGDAVSATQSAGLVAFNVVDGVNEEQAVAAVESVTQDFPQAKLQTTEQFKDDQAAQIDQLLVIITVLLGFAILIAVLGISITLGLAVFERTREIGLMRAVGMTKRQTRRMVRWEAVIVSTFGAVIGIVLGTLIGVALAIAVPKNVIDEVSFSPSTTVFVLVGAVIAGLVAALYPSYKASNMNVLDAIATE